MSKKRKRRVLKNRNPIAKVVTTLVPKVIPNKKKYKRIRKVINELDT